MCHSLLDDASFWCLLVDIDRELAAAIRSQGCPCGGTLHSARYPRKPRGWPREQLGVDYESRLSFCCNQEGCRRRCTPPSVRYFGRRVQLPATRTWRELQGQFASPLDTARLPDVLLQLVQGDDPVQRLVRFLALLMPLSTGSCSHCPRVAIKPKRMPL